MVIDCQFYKQYNGLSYYKTYVNFVAIKQSVTFSDFANVPTPDH